MTIIFGRIRQWFRRREDGPMYDEPFVADEAAQVIREDVVWSNRPRFHARASDSLPVARGDGSRSVRARLRLAFTPSQPVSDIRMFAGRNDMLLKLIRAIEDQQLHVVLYGDRGMGKTSLLRMLTNLAREARYFVHYVSCSESSEFDATFRTVAAALPIMYHDDYGPTSTEAEQGGSIANLLPTRPVGVADISELFAKISGTRVLVILDEYDRSTSGEFHRSIADLIKTLSDRSSRVQIVIGGVAPNLTALIEHIPSIRRNVIGIAVGKLTEDELGQLLNIGEKAGGLSFSEDARAAIVHASNGSPYLAGLLGQQAGMAATDLDRITVEIADVRTALDRAIEEVEQRVTPRAQQALAASRDCGLAPSLVVMARQSLDHFGVIPAATMLANETHDAGIKQTCLSNLIQGSENGGGEARFLDDGVPLLLWLNDVRATLTNRFPQAEGMIRSM